MFQKFYLFCLANITDQDRKKGLHFCVRAIIIVTIDNLCVCRLISNERNSKSKGKMIRIDSYMRIISYMIKMKLKMF